MVSCIVHIGNFAYSTSVIQQSDGSLVLTGHGGALAAIRQGDGKIVFAGLAIASDGATDIALARFNTNGNLDPTFNGDGGATLDVGGTSEHAVGLALQPGGKLRVVAGQSNVHGTNQAFLARYDVTGTLDATFGDGGLAFVDVGSGLAFRVTDLAQQADGKLVVAGTAEGADRSKLGLVRVTTDGALDSTFHGDGLLLMEFEGRLAEASSVSRFSPTVRSSSAVTSLSRRKPLMWRYCGPKLEEVRTTVLDLSGWQLSTHAKVALSFRLACKQMAGWLQKA